MVRSAYFKPIGFAIGTGIIQRALSNSKKTQKLKAS
jgi:hypothetical protein